MLVETNQLAQGKGPVSGFWEHGGDLSFYGVFKMQIICNNRHSSKRYALSDCLHVSTSGGNRQVGYCTFQFHVVD